MNGCQNVSYLRASSVPDPVFTLETAQAEADPLEGLQLIQATAEQRAIADASKTMMPLSIGRVLLSLLLVAASATVLAGRPGSRSFALQAILANAAFAVASYILTQPIREAWVAAVAVDASTLDFSKLPQGILQPAGVDFSGASFWYTRARFALGMELAVLSIAGAAVLSQRTRIFMDAVARAEERLEREDEP